MDSKRLKNFWILLLTDSQEKSENIQISLLKRIRLANFWILILTSSRSAKNSNRDFGRQLAGKFLNLAFNGVQQKIEMVLLAGRRLANFSILFLTDSRPAKNQNTLLVGRWPAKSFFLKKGDWQEKHYYGYRSRMGTFIRTILSRAERLFKFKKKTGRRKLTLHQYC